MPRKASTSITLTTLAALSLAFATACSDDGPEVTADCVVKQPDGTYKAVDDDLCDDDHHGGSSFVWIYGGSSGNNGRITGGTFNRPANANISTRSGSVISRGGFGGRSGGGS